MLSKISYIICTTILLYACFGFYPKWHNKATEATIGWDVSGYYWYLPSIFIYKDLKHQSFADSILKKYEPTPILQQFSRNESGNCVMTYSSGMAFMYLPLFTLAHIAAPTLGYPADGFSLPYQFALQVGSMLIGLFGLWYFKRFLLIYYEDKVVAVLLLLLVAGTNYLNYTAIDGAMTHNWLFTIYVLLLLGTQKFYNTPSYKYAAIIGILFGLAILIRPSEMVAFIIPLLWGLQSLSAQHLKQHFTFLQQHKLKIMFAVLFTLLIGSIQLIYWKYATGQWVYYSYRGEGQYFNWLKPDVINYMFSFRSGWLIYTPLLLLAFIGIIPFIKRKHNNISILLFCILSLYVVTAWNVWDYGGYGGRAMIQSYPVLFIPIGALIQQMFDKRILLWGLLPFILLFIYINIWFTIQAHSGTGVLIVNSMTRAYYMKVIGRWYPENLTELQKLMDTNELFESSPNDMKLIHTYNYETDSNILMPDKAIEGERSAYVQAGVENSTKAIFSIPHRTKWLRVQVDAKCYLKEWEVWRMPQLFVRFNTKDGKEVKTRMLRLHRWLTKDYQTKQIFIDVIVPEEPFDYVEVYLWNPGSDKLLMIDNLQVWSFNE